MLEDSMSMVWLSLSKVGVTNEKKADDDKFWSI